MIAMTEDQKSLPCIFGTTQDHNIIRQFLWKLPIIRHEAIYGTDRLEVLLPFTYTLEQFYVDVRTNIPNGQSLINKIGPLGVVVAIPLPKGLPTNAQQINDITSF